MGCWSVVEWLFCFSLGSVSLFILDSLGWMGLADEDISIGLLEARSAMVKFRSIFSNEDNRLIIVVMAFFPNIALAGVKWTGDGPLGFEDILGEVVSMWAVTTFSSPIARVFKGGLKDCNSSL